MKSKLLICLFLSALIAFGSFTACAQSTRAVGVLIVDDIDSGDPYKDAIKQQKQVPIRALISLEQAPENSIRRLTKQEAMIVLLNQVMMPMWDDAAMALLTPLMGQLATEIPFYHLKNLPNKEATELTRNTITR